VTIVVNREYQKFGRENFASGDDSFRANQPELLPNAFRSLWDAYENFLDGSPSLNGPSMRERNLAFEKLLVDRGLLDHFVRGVLRLPEAGLLADLQPRIFREQTFQQQGVAKTDEHDAYSSDHERLRAGRLPKEPVARLLNLLSVVRNNLQHGQKVLPKDWPEMRDRNLQVLRLAVPVQHKLIVSLFETIWTEGIFAYGTLRAASTRYDLVRSLVTNSGEEYFVSGKLYDLGSHPGLVLGAGDRVHGEMLRSERLHELLHRIDELEGADFIRRLTWVTSIADSRERSLAWVCEYRGQTSGVPRCRGGVWPRLIDGGA
jgi:gamma-glutamylcyclotransferase (GGCT)/AIG2-like uncharacterized protein YtfP